MRLLDNVEAAAALEQATLPTSARPAPDARDGPGKQPRLSA